MRKKIIAFSILACGFLASCDDLVEVQPQNSLSADTALTDINNYEALLISAYDRVQSFNYWGRDFALLGDALADNIYTNSDLAGGRYVGANRNVRGSHYNIWGTAYTAINELNTIIAQIDGLAVPTSQEAKKQQIKGEALALRGMIYFDLARVYGYEPTQVASAGQGFNSSVIIRTEPVDAASEADFRERATVTEVYEQIEADFEAALPLLEGKSVSEYRMNEGAAYALLGKVYLYWERYDDAIAAFNSALETDVAELGTDYTNIFEAAPSRESFFEVRFVPSTEMAGVTGGNNSLFSYTNPTGTANPEGLTTFGGQTAADELVALFGEDDERAEMFYDALNETWAYKWRSSIGDYTDNVKVIRYADVLLMKAEALVRKANPDVAQAIEILADLREARGADVDAIPTSANAIFEFIKDERRRELFFEGHRWFDLKRWGDGITKPARTAISSIAPTDYRILAPIPNNELILNEMLVPNPGY